ncbi:hypothetical protein SD70_17450 [Gordoniibacillus kamchatkensis]|uniref:GlsB/YeaQ/YmgE family stress response membrane protein n=1 Tax=Gordoniibacillus kamchatkensis TaxID=1590651 RepID=A0ABR5AG94_9BACL|nr:GlsB/YeaQ/YmgE family stress response membrane protein [Paenibacillus sp. VKM B-2647]KIL39848.1 hypothetical protein SD70_17450 [Paenibacillus sp. VKM B-2647]
MLSVIISIVIAIVIGYIGEALVKFSMPAGILGAMIAGFVGSWLGTLLLGSWGPVIAGFPVVPAIAGAALFVFLLGLIAKKL